MNIRVQRNAALGVAMTLAVAVVVSLLWATGSAQTIRADNLDVCPSGCPYATIQDAVYAAQDGDTIRVAAGTYTGTMLCDVWGSGVFTSTLCITEDLILLGGYNPADFIRDPDQYTTTISWEGEPGHIVVDLVNGTSATVDGFQITGAVGAPIGAIYVRDSAPTISHNRIIGNHTAGNGAGIHVSLNSTPTIESNVILSNTAEQSGGGIAVGWGATAVISGNLIAYNEAITNAGGIYVEGSVVTVTNNHILSNTVANNGGGGFLVEHGSTFVASGNTFRGNFAGCCGGGMAAWWDTTGKIIGNEFESNTAGFWMGGGIYLDGGPYDVAGNVVAYNQVSGEGGGGIALRGEGSQATVTNNLVLSNTALVGGAGGIMISWGPKAVVQANEIVSNTAYDWGASGLYIYSATVLVDRNLIANNIRENYPDGDGAIWIEMDDQSVPVTITNNVIVDNVDKGIGIWEDGVFDLTIVNNTIAHNRNEGVMVYGSSVVSLLRNNVITSNGYCGIAASEGAEIQSIDYNDVWNNGGGSGNYCDYGGAAVPPGPGPGSISVDPQFVDAAAGDYHLVWGSPAINTGTNVDAPAYDKDDVPRPQMSRVDMGAYEQIGFAVFLPLVLGNY